MSDETTKPNTETEAPETDDAPPSRIAGAVVVLVLAVAVVIGVRALVRAFPYVAYFVAGVLVTVAVQRIAAWGRKRRSDDTEEAEEEELPDVGEALRKLSRGQDHVLLSGLRKELRAANTKAVRALLKAEGIRVRAGVRAPTGNGPGVHYEDIPPALPASDEAHPDGCCCRPANNNNANNGDEDPSQKGLSVETTGEMTIIRDLAETHQRRTQVPAGAVVNRFLALAEQARKNGSGKSRNT